jgi:hypothetical protein
MLTNTSSVNAFSQLAVLSISNLGPQFTIVREAFAQVASTKYTHTPCFRAGFTDNICSIIYVGDAESLDAPISNWSVYSRFILSMRKELIKQFDMYVARVKEILTNHFITVRGMSAEAANKKLETIWNCMEEFLGTRIKLNEDPEDFRDLHFEGNKKYGVVRIACVSIGNKCRYLNYKGYKCNKNIKYGEIVCQDHK